MKKLILAAAGASLLAAPALAAPYGYHASPVRQQAYSSQYHGHAQQNQRQYQRKWNRGERFDSRYASNYREIRNPRAYHLREAPRGYRWVQSGNDAVLVAVASGIIGAILGNMF